MQKSITANITTPGEFREENPYKDDLCKTDENISFNCLISEDCPCERFGKFAAEHPLLPALDPSNNPLPKGWSGKVELVYQFFDGDFDTWQTENANAMKMTFEQYQIHAEKNGERVKTRRIYRSIEPAEAVKEVDKKLYDLIDKCKQRFDAGDYDITDCMIRAAQWQSQQDREGWVDVNKRVPKLNTNVLVFGEQNGMNPQMGGAYVSIAMRLYDNVPKTLRGTTICCEFGFRMMRYVTHWRELPGPPQQALNPKDN